MLQLRKPIKLFLYNSNKIKTKLKLNNGFSILVYNKLPIFLFTKFRRYLIARSKKNLNFNNNLNKVWVRLGLLVFLFKKPINSRMGKGGGSLFSSRRYVFANSLLFYITTKKKFNFLFKLNYINSRVGLKTYKLCKNCNSENNNYRLRQRSNTKNTKLKAIIKKFKFNKVIKKFNLFLFKLRFFRSRRFIFKLLKYNKKNFLRKKILRKYVFKW